jgi:anthrone oxygenase-like protein
LTIIATSARPSWSATEGGRRNTVKYRSRGGDNNVALKAARFPNLFLTGVLTGNEFGGFVGFHPALYRLPTEAHASAEQAITARFGRIMPPFMIATIISFVPVLSLTRDRRSFSFTAAGMLCYLAMLAVTFAGNMPANRRTLDLDPKTVSGDAFLSLRRRWDGFHAARILLNAAGLVFTILGTLSDTESGG